MDEDKQEEVIDSNNNDDGTEEPNNTPEESETPEAPEKPEPKTNEELAELRNELGLPDSATPKEVLTKIKELRAQKAHFQKKSVKKDIPKTSNTEERLELIAAGLKRELVDQLEVIARGQGITLNEAKESSMGKVLIEDYDHKARERKAQLGASKGSPAAPDENWKTRDEHKAQFKKQLQSKGVK